MSDKPIKKKTSLNNPKLRLTKKTEKGYANLGFDLYQNSIHIKVNTNDPALKNQENGFGIITAALDAVVFYIALDVLDTAIHSETEYKVKFENFNHEYVDGKRNKEPTHVNDLWIGRDKAGMIFISVVSRKQNFPVIKFEFDIPDARYHTLLKADGSKFTRSEISVLAAKAFLTLLKEITANVLNSNFFEPPPYNPNKTSGGYNGKSQKYTNNYTESNIVSNDSIEDDDIPF